MNNDLDLKALWQQQLGVPVPDTKELFLKAEQLKRKTRTKIIITNVLLLLTCVFIVYEGYSFHPKMITTKIGILMMVIAMVAYLFVYNGMIPLLLKTNQGMSTREYLQQFLKIKQKQEFLSKTMLSVYFILLSLGLFFYFIEVAGMLGMVAKAVVYGATTFWILFVWKYIRPRTIKKQQAALDKIIAKLQDMNKQLANKPDDTQ
jgi:hypothetical protein